VVLHAGTVVLDNDPTPVYTVLCDFQLLLQPDMLLTRPKSSDSHDLSHVLVVLPPEPNLVVGLLALLLSG
jgi:hypothetical protein